MTFDPTKPVQTRDGRKARILGTIKNDDYPIVAAVSDGPYEECEEYSSEGFYYRKEEPSKFDLVNVPDERELWVNVYDRGGIAVSSHGSKDDADECAFRDRIARLHISFAVGQLDE